MLNKIKNIKLSKSKYIYTVIAGLIIIALGVTFAWWRWRSEINALVNGEVCAPEIVFVGGTTINGHDLLPVRTKEEGLSKDIQVNLNNTCDNDTAVLNLNLKPDVFPEGLSDSSFKWALYEVTTEEVQGVPTETLTYVNDGNFNGKRQYVNDNDLISIATDLIVTENISTYRLYIWIDGTMDNPSAIGDNFFKFSIFGTGRDAIYREYVVNSNVISGTNKSYFLVDALPKTDIESIDITDFNGLPEGSTTISLNGENDRSILVSYIDEDEDGLYEVYIGTSNGTLTLNTKMDYMFAGLTNVSTLDLSRLDTSNVTSMVGVFYNSPSLTSINMNNWDTSNVTNMSKMFQSASGLTSLDVSEFDTSKVTTMASMFQNAGASSLIINIDNFNTPKVTTMASMFNGCKASSINLSNFSNELLTNMSSMFYNCKSFSINFSDFNTSSVTNMQSAFYNCSNLTSLDLSTFNTSNVTTMCGKGFTTGMFESCSNLVHLNISSFDTSKVTNMTYMFASCSKLSELDLSNFDTSKVTTFVTMFRGCSSLTSLDLSNFNTSNVTRMGNMFYGCSKLSTVNLSNFDTRKVTDMGDMFYYCSNLTTLDLSSFETPSLTSLRGEYGWGMFNGCKKLKKIDMSNFSFDKITAKNMNLLKDTPADIDITVNNCTQYNKFVELYGSKTNLHTINNDNCTV